jgi:hypothetical protein
MIWLRFNRIRALAAALATVAAGIVVAAVLFSQTNCTSNCGSNCPSRTVYIGNLDNQQLYIDDIVVNGPACPPQYGIYCIGDGDTTSCTHVTITGVAQGACDVTIIFQDRPAWVVHTEFGPPIMQGCCRGYSIVGDSVFVIPSSSDAGISGIDGATDAARLADGGTGNDDGGVADAGPSP